MGIYKNCYTTTAPTIEYAVIGLYDEAEARNVGPSNPGFDDVTGEPFLEDADDDGLGERVRPEAIVTVKAKADWTRSEEQRQDGAGNAPESMLELKVYVEDLEAQGLLSAGVVAFRPNDRLLRLQNGDGQVRVDFEHDGRDGLHCYEVRPSRTGEDHYVLMFLNRRPVER